MLLYQRAEDSLRKLEAPLATRETVIEAALGYTHGMFEELGENSGLFASPYRQYADRIGKAVNYLDLALERARKGYACEAVVFCCRACDELCYTPLVRPGWWRWWHPWKSHDRVVLEQRFRYWLRLEHGSEQSVIELWKKTNEMVSSFAPGPSYSLYWKLSPWPTAK
jgi:hypothetical protein